MTTNHTTTSQAQARTAELAAQLAGVPAPPGAVVGDWTDDAGRISRRWTAATRELGPPVAGFIETFGEQDSTGAVVGLVAVEAVGDGLTAGQARALGRLLIAAADEAQRIT